jgi:hypothetical protein
MLPILGAQADKIKEVTYADIIVDEAEMLGKTIMVPGVMVHLGSTNYLYEYAGTLTALTIETTKISKMGWKDKIMNIIKGETNLLLN